MARRQRNRKPDAQQANEIAGKSEISKYPHGLGWKARHSQRLSLAHKHYADAAVWCEENGWSLRISNEGHHWMFTKNGVLAEWWPSSAKLVRDKVWSKGIHTHGWDQVAKILDGWGR